MTKSTKLEDWNSIDLDAVEMKPAEKPVSLCPLKFEEALKGLAQTSPMKPSKREH